VVIEAAVGWWQNSLALLSDAGHNLSDVVSLILALIAFKLMYSKATQSYTYGYKKVTVLVALLNALFCFWQLAELFTKRFLDFIILNLYKEKQWQL
jgi:cobalt-zinc-cadmium efflux system protein